MAQETKGGSSEGYTPPPEGPVLLRFVEYVELGKRRSEYAGEVKVLDKVQMVFELHGPKYNGERIRIVETWSLHDKANFKKLFLAMRNGDNSITHMAQMLGKPFKGRIFHSKFTGRDGKEKVSAKLRDANGYHITAPISEDPETGEVKVLNVPEAKSPLRLFLWDFADQAMWDSLYMDGVMPDGRSKNFIQNDIREAVNFPGSRIDRLLSGANVERLVSAVDTTPPPRSTCFRPRSFVGGQQGIPTRPEVSAFDKAIAEEGGE